MKQINYITILILLCISQVNTHAQATRKGDGIVQGPFIQKRMIASSKNGARIYRYKFKSPRPDEIWLVNFTKFDLNYSYTYTLTDALTGKKQPMQSGSHLLDLRKKNAISIKKGETRLLQHVTKSLGFKGSLLHTLIRKK